MNKTAETAGTQYAKYWIQDEILYCDFAKNIDINLEIAKLCIAERKKVSNGKTYPALVFISNIKSVSKSARDYFASDEAVSNINASAFVVGSNVSKIMGNIFLTFNKPPVPLKLFTTEADALKWLQNYIDKGNAGS